MSQVGTVAKFLALPLCPWWVGGEVVPAPPGCELSEGKWQSDSGITEAKQHPWLPHSLFSWKPA